jgi:hypothetical protein
MLNNTNHSKLDLSKLTNKISFVFYNNAFHYDRTEYIFETELNMTFRFEGENDNEHFSIHLSFNFETLSFSGRFSYFKYASISKSPLRFNNIEELNNLTDNETLSINTVNKLRKHTLKFISNCRL